jgi:hypothetical protein
VSVSIPTSYDIDLDLGGALGAVGPVTVAGIPTSFSLDLALPPTIQLALQPLTLEPITLEPVSATVDIGSIPAITLNPVSLNVALTQIPNVRAHVPSNYSVGLSLFGIEVFAIRLCGETQVITEPYKPNPCEICGPLEGFENPLIPVGAVTGK